MDAAPPTAVALSQPATLTRAQELDLVVANAKEQPLIVPEAANNVETIAPVNEAPQVGPNDIPALPISSDASPGSRPSSAPTERGRAKTPTTTLMAKDTSELPSELQRKKSTSTPVVPLDVKQLSEKQVIVKQSSSKSVLLTEDDHLRDIETFLRSKTFATVRAFGTVISTRISDIFSRLSSQQIRSAIAPMMERLQAELGATLTVDIQTSLCVINELVLELGRASPLAGMYTDEEEALLDTLEHRTVL
ncbi:hypothetical protein ACHHYP_15448 [Achlya hypogyna]|uniref:Uncharacterized protein n=1 Tax=Achlya hypogyna TaxID=1202772 RepID=A0A1V9YAX1_ACHHY|nr:hypothetical protein ACHHYP_15448 [Achlya hypogyna]